MLSEPFHTWLCANISSEMPGDTPDFLKQRLTVANHIWSRLESLQRGGRETLTQQASLSPGSSSGCGSLGNVLKIMLFFFFFFLFSSTVPRKDFLSKWHFVNDVADANLWPFTFSQTSVRFLKVCSRFTSFVRSWLSFMSVTTEQKMNCVAQMQFKKI